MKKLPSALLSIALAACGGGGGGTATQSTNSNASAVGTWVSNCYLSFPDQPAWSIAEFDIADTTISNVFANYSDDRCTTPYSGSANLWKGYHGTYVQLPNVATSSGVDAYWYRATYNIDPPLPTDVVAELGVYINNDELSEVVQVGGLYVIALSPKYYKQ